jgi:MFS family permease
LHETPRNFGSGKSQAIMGIQMASAYVGTTFMPPLFGRIASYLDFNIFPFYIGGILLIHILMVELLNRRIDKSNSVKIADASLHVHT